MRAPLHDPELGEVFGSWCRKRSRQPMGGRRSPRFKTRQRRGKSPRPGLADLVLKLFDFGVAVVAKNFLPAGSSLSKRMSLAADGAGNDSHRLRNQILRSASI